MVTATPMQDVEAAYGQGREEQLLLDIMCDAALTCRERHAYMPTTEEERRNFTPHLWALEGASEYANHAYAEGRKDEAEDWRAVSADGMPPCDGETVYIGINSNGFAACFNAMTPDGCCLMGGPECSTAQMSGLEWWRVLNRPRSEA
jgi:hypothetical protein